MSGFLTTEVYRELCARLDALGWAQDRVWSENVRAPATPADLVREYAWVVINSGMKNTVARGIMDRVWPFLIAGATGPAPFGHRGKMGAIADVWERRESAFLQFMERASMSTDDVLEWCESLPWIGKITKYHLAKNLGVDCAKPDRWLVRLAEAEGETVDGLCQRLARATGHRIATVDLVLWRGCATGELHVHEGRIWLSREWPTADGNTTGNTTTAALDSSSENPTIRNRKMIAHED